MLKKKLSKFTARS